MRSDRATMAVADSLDVWSLGIVAVELLTRARVFPRHVSIEEVERQLLEGAPLPWEDAATRPELAAALKGLKRSVLACLARDPAARPTALELHGQWCGLFEQTTGATSDSFVFGEAPGDVLRPASPQRAAPGDVAGGAHGARLPSVAVHSGSTRSHFGL